MASGNLALQHLLPCLVPGKKLHIVEEQDNCLTKNPINALMISQKIRILSFSPPSIILCVYVWANLFISVHVYLF